MRYVGVDYHKRSSYVTVVDERGKVVKQANLANSKQALEAFLDGAGDDQPRGRKRAGNLCRHCLVNLPGAAAAPCPHRPEPITVLGYTLPSDGVALIPEPAAGFQAQDTEAYKPAL